MHIIEVRNDILKLAYSPFRNSLLLSDFLLVSEGAKSILAQVIGLESSQEKDTNIATLKGCLSVDENGKINAYIGFTPSTNAEISPVSQEQVISMLCDNENPVIWGYLAQHDNVLFKTQQELLKNKPLILMDDYANYNVIANNIVYSNTTQNEKTVLVDFDGSLKIDNAYYIKLGEDFKFPLSYHTLNYIYENDLKGESLSTQAVVQDIIIELQEYILTLSEGFLPFSTIKNVIYAQYEENKIPELMLFKNKFVKYSQQDIFAETNEDFNFINEAIAENDIVVIDATELEQVWHRLLLNYLAKDINTNCFLIAKLENDNSNKKTILDIYNNRTINPILVSNYSHDFMNVMKSIAKNLILFPPIKAMSDFATYNSFMQKLSRDEYVICGEDTLYLSFLVKLTYINTNMSPEYIEEQIQQDVDKLYRAGSQKNTSTVQPQRNILEEETLSHSNVEIETSYNETADENVEIPSNDVEDNEDVMTEDDLDFLDEMDSLEREAVDEIQDDSEVIDELPQELDSTSDNSYIEEEQIITNEYVEEPIIKDNDSFDDEVIDPLQDSPAHTTPNVEQPEEYSFTDEAKQSEPKMQPVEEPSIVPPQPIPVYSVPELDNEDSLGFNEGNFVYHEKYGKGAIEKILTYGTKTLLSIEFEEVGRRLLDPNIAGLKQI